MLTLKCDPCTSGSFPKGDNTSMGACAESKTHVPSPPEGVATMYSTETINPPETVAETNLLNLLIVDDERAVRESCREVAETLGFSTLVADSPEQAYRMLDTLEHGRGAARPASAGNEWLGSVAGNQTASCEGWW